MATLDDAETEYLQPGFDPASLTIPKLRGILVAHNVVYPSSAKKAQLVDLFNQEIAPQAKRLLAARSRTKRSTRGIVDVPSADASVDGDSEVEEVAPAKTPRPKKTKTSADGEPQTARKTPGKKTTSRKSTVTPSVKAEEEENVNPSAFSSENVFQTGSSPSVEPRSESRRRTTGSEPEKKARSASRRKTDGAVPVSRSPSKRKSHSVEVSPKVEDVPAGEEFTPEESQALAREPRRETTRELQVTRPKRQTSSIAKLAPTAILLALLGGVATIWRQEKVAVGFCGVGNASDRLAGIELPPHIRDIVQPQCEPCPPHAYCYADLDVQCEEGFVKVYHPLALGGAVPLPPTCEPDGERAKKVQAVADRAVEELRIVNAAYECGDLRDEDTGKKAASPAVPEAALKDKVASRRRRNMSQDEFEELWASALGELVSRDEVVIDGSPSGSQASQHGSGRLFHSTSLVRIPVACAVRRSVRLALARHFGKLVLVAAALGGLVYGRVWVAARRADEARAQVLAAEALERLAQQAAFAQDDATNDDDGDDAYVGVAQLRDDVLRSESRRRRQHIWQRVSALVEDNANVRSAVRVDGRSGEVGRAWQWIGHAETPTGYARRKSGAGRRSLGPPEMGQLATPSPLGGDTPYTWRERPVY